MSNEQHLSPEQRELVAVGASVGAGCRPCVSHHLKAGAEAGLDGGHLLAAVASAERVSAEAAVAMGDHARGKLGPDVTPALLSRLEEALASLGAALGANDKTNIERQLHTAAELGASRSQLEQAIETAHTVQENAARIHLREAERLLDALASATAAVSDADAGDSCGCSVDEKTEHAPETAEEPLAATSGHAGGCGAMAARFAAGGPSGAMAGCREMFAEFSSAAAPTEIHETPAPTAGTGSCKKEA